MTAPTREQVLEWMQEAKIISECAKNNAPKDFNLEMEFDDVVRLCALAYAAGARDAERLRRDAARLDWLERKATLHTHPDILYVVDGYQVTVLFDAIPSTDDGPYHGETLRDAIDSAMGAQK